MVENYRKFYEAVGEQYPEEDVVYASLSGRLRKKFVLDHLLKWRGSFLDVGCNIGTYLKEYQGGFKAGADLSFAVIRKLRLLHPELSLINADAQEPGCFKSQSFDHVLCSEVLEHVPDPQSVVAEIARVLKENGEVLLTTPNYKRQRPEWVDVGILRKFGVEGVKGDRYFHTAFKPHELAEMGEAAGLTLMESGTFEKEIKYAAKGPALLFIIFRWINHRILRTHCLDAVNQRFYSALTIGVYNISRVLGLNALLVRFISEGVRSFALLRKAS